MPYIGDLLGVQGLRPVPGSGAEPRALVANTIRYRRRKGTPGRARAGGPRRHRLAGPGRRVLRAAGDHPAPGPRAACRPPATADLRDADGLALVGTPFDAHRPDRRRAAHRHRPRPVQPARHRAAPVAARRPTRSTRRRTPGRPAAAGRSTRPGRDLPPVPSGPHGDRATRPPGRRSPTCPARCAAGDRSGTDLRADGAGVPDAAPIRRSGVARRRRSRRRCRLTALRLSPPISSPRPERLGPPTGATGPRSSRSIRCSAGSTVRDGTRAVTGSCVDYAYGSPGDVGAGPHDRRDSLATALATTDLGADGRLVRSRCPRTAAPVPGTHGVARSATRSGSGTHRTGPRARPGRRHRGDGQRHATRRTSTVVGSRPATGWSSSPPTGRPPARQPPSSTCAALAARGVRPHLVGDIQAVDQGRRGQRVRARRVVGRGRRCSVQPGALTAASARGLGLHARPAACGHGAGRQPAPGGPRPAHASPPGLASGRQPVP